jgi:hypothetical protein
VSTVEELTETVSALVAVAEGALAEVRELTAAVHDIRVDIGLERLLERDS